MIGPVAYANNNHDWGLDINAHCYSPCSPCNSSVLSVLFELGKDMTARHNAVSVNWLSTLVISQVGTSRTLDEQTWVKHFMAPELGQQAVWAGVVLLRRLINCKPNGQQSHSQQLEQGCYSYGSDNLLCWLGLGQHIITQVSGCTYGLSPLSNLNPSENQHEGDRKIHIFSPTETLEINRFSHTRHKAVLQIYKFEMAPQICET